MLLQGGPHLEKIHLDLCNHLNAGDIVVDGGSYHHIFTPRRWKFFAEHGIHYVAVGFAASGHGHEHGCRALFPAFQETCRRIRPIFESAAASASGEPCVIFVGQRVVQQLLLLENGNNLTAQS
jgi:6-phosphogluconate dehydrogenase